MSLGRQYVHPISNQDTWLYAHECMRKRGIVQSHHGHRHETFEMPYMSGTHRSQQLVYSPVPACINMYPSPVLANIVFHYQVATLLTGRVTDMVVEKKKGTVAVHADQ